MKKFLFIGLGISALAAALIPLGSASRDVYQQYLVKKATEYRTERHFSDRQGVLRRSLSSRTGNRQDRKVTNQLIPNLRYPTGDKRYLYDNTRKPVSKHVVRPASENIRSFQNRNSARLTIPMPKTLDSAPYEFVTYANDYFSLQIPSGWIPTHDENGIFHLGSDSHFSVSVQRFENGCTSERFMTCAVALAKNENAMNPLEKMTNMSQVYRSARKSDNILGSFEQTNEYTESFVGLSGGTEEFVARHFVSGIDGEVFLIETRSNVSSATKSIATSKVFFDSFRLYPAEMRHIFNIDE